MRVSYNRVPTKMAQMDGLTEADRVVIMGLEICRITGLISGIVRFFEGYAKDLPVTMGLDR